MHNTVLNQTRKKQNKKKNTKNTTKQKNPHQIKKKKKKKDDYCVQNVIKGKRTTSQTAFWDCYTLLRIDVKLNCADTWLAPVGRN